MLLAAVALLAGVPAASADVVHLKIKEGRTVIDPGSNTVIADQNAIVTSPYTWLLTPGRDRDSRRLARRLPPGRRPGRAVRRPEGQRRQPLRSGLPVGGRRDDRGVRELPGELRLAVHPRDRPRHDAVRRDDGQTSPTGRSSRASATWPRASTWSACGRRATRSPAAGSPSPAGPATPAEPGRRPERARLRRSAIRCRPRRCASTSSRTTCRPTASTTSAPRWA